MKVLREQTKQYYHESFHNAILHILYYLYSTHQQQPSTRGYHFQARKIKRPYITPKIQYHQTNICQWSCFKYPFFLPLDIKENISWQKKVVKTKTKEMNLVKITKL